MLVRRSIKLLSMRTLSAIRRRKDSIAGSESESVSFGKEDKPDVVFFPTGNNDAANGGCKGI
jgi:hypothetical protein